MIGFSMIFFLILLVGIILAIVGLIKKSILLKIIGILLSAGAIILFLNIAMFGC